MTSPFVNHALNTAGAVAGAAAAGFLAQAQPVEAVRTLDSTDDNKDNPIITIFGVIAGLAAPAIVIAGAICCYLARCNARDCLGIRDRDDTPNNGSIDLQPIANTIQVALPQLETDDEAASARISTVVDDTSVEGQPTFTGNVRRSENNPSGCNR